MALASLNDSSSSSSTISEEVTLVTMSYKAEF